MIEILMGMMIKVVLLVALGYGLKKKGKISEELDKGLSGLLVNVIFPISVIASANNEFSLDKLRNILIIMAVALIYYIGAILLSTRLGKLIGLDREKQPIFMKTTISWK